ncbi:MAG: RNA 3'-terminal phosphate cyclase [Planctomycetota bacterium]
MLVIDGSFGEGGGQIFRTALSLSLLTGRPFRIRKIRANRSNPGLAAQHLACARLARDISLADVEGDALGSREIEFRPRPVRSGRYRCVIPTAGSAALVLQTVLVPLSLAGGTTDLDLEGGTHVPWSPCFHYLERVFLPILSAAGYDCRAELVRPGYFPKGGGVLRCRISPVVAPASLELSERGPLRAVEAIAAVSALPVSVAKRMLAEMEKLLAAGGCTLTSSRVLDLGGAFPGAFAGLVANFENGRAGAFALGAKGKSAEEVGREAVSIILSFLCSSASVDAHLADQLVLPLAALNVPARWTTPEVTLHLYTNVTIVNTFLPARVRLIGELGAPGSVAILPSRSH